MATVYKLDTETMFQCGLDPTDAADRAEFSPRFLIKYNEAYREITRKKIQPFYKESITLDANKRFNATDLTETLAEIKHITQYADFSEDASFAQTTRYAFYDYDNNGEFVVPGVEASTAVYVEYMHYWDELVAMLADDLTPDENQEPQFSSEWHYALSHWATAHYYRGEGTNYKDQVAFYEDEYYSMLGKITNKTGTRLAIRNAFFQL